jgi:hypothetical protein
MSCLCPSAYASLIAGTTDVLHHTWLINWDRGLTNFLPTLASNRNFLNLCFLNIWNYSLEPLHLASSTQNLIENHSVSSWVLQAELTWALVISPIRVQLSTACLSTTACLFVVNCSCFPFCSSWVWNWLWGSKGRSRRIMYLRASFYSQIFLLSLSVKD